MKVIGTTQERGGDYIAIVTHSELEKLTENYYGKLPSLKVGDSIDLGAGYNFRSEIQSACRAMEDASKAFSKAQTTMLAFSVMVGQLPDCQPVEGGAT